MQGWKSHVLVPVVWVALTLGLLLAGCSTKEDPNEVLDLCGNHSCGSLVMVTTDTSSEGYQYLEPVLSDDGGRIYFSADYAALTPTSHPPDPLPINRQIMSMPVREGDEPLRFLAENGAKVLQYYELRYWANNEAVAVLDERQKGSPQILSDHEIAIWVHLDRGARLVKLDLSVDAIFCQPETLYLEPEDYTNTGRIWHHRDPAVSPDRKWIAFSRFGYDDYDSLATYTGQEIWVASLEPAAAAPRPRAFAVTSSVSMVGGPAWSPDSRRLVFHAGLDLAGSTGGGSEIFTMTFDTTGLAANRGVALNRDLHRITYSESDFGNPLRGVQNLNPVFTSDGDEIVFVSTRRAPSITLYDRNIWRVPADGRLDPEILFFTRADDVDPFIPVGIPNMLLLSSALGFPTELLDRIEQARFDTLMQDSTYTEPEARLEAQQERRELEFFERVMSHIYIFRGWQ